MAKNIGKNSNTSDEAIIHAPISINATTSTKILDVDDRRIYVAISVRDKDVWLKFQAASVDNNKRGIFVQRNQTYEMATDNMYTGEISAICENGTANIYITEL